MRLISLFGTSLLLLVAQLAHADPCRVTIESNDSMQFSMREMVAPQGCADFEVTLHNTGSLPAHVMGHDWVLARVADQPGIMKAAAAAGPARGWLPQNDARIIAATQLVGGGASTTVRFSTAGLEPGGQYVFFCSFPGHATIMHGRFLFGGTPAVAARKKPDEPNSAPIL